MCECMGWGLGLSVLRVWVLSLADVAPEGRGAGSACFYLVYSEAMGWRWCVYVHNSNRTSWEAPGDALKTLNQSRGRPFQLPYNGKRIM